MWAPGEGRASCQRRLAKAIGEVQAEISVDSGDAEKGCCSQAKPRSEEFATLCGIPGGAFGLGQEKRDMKAANEVFNGDPVTLSQARGAQLANRPSLEPWSPWAQRFRCPEALGEFVILGVRTHLRYLCGQGMSEFAHSAE